MATPRSPILHNAEFTLPFFNVVEPVEYVSDSVASDVQLDSVDDAEISNLLRPRPANDGRPTATIGRFLSMGSPRFNPGLHHTVFFSRRPTAEVYRLGDQLFRVSGYLSYNFLMSGSVVAGVVFSSDAGRTVKADHKLVVRSHGVPSNFKPNFNLEKLGLLMFVADNSTTLVIPTGPGSNLVVRTDA